MKDFYHQTKNQSPTVQQLIDYLLTQPPDALVVLMSDEEGNDQGVLGQASEGDPNHPPVVFLWPVNGTVEMEYDDLEGNS